MRVSECVENIRLDSTAYQTLKALGNELRLQKFILRGTIKRKKEFEHQEVETRKKIHHLMNKVQWELDRQNKINESENKN